MNQLGMDARAIQSLIYTQSGLLGVSGISSDMRTLRASKDPRAALAVDLFIYRIERELGSLAAALGGLDAIVFTGGIGEHDAFVRERVCRGAAWLGIELDARPTPLAARASARRQPRRRLGDSDQRRADDRAAHARPAPRQSRLITFRGDFLSRFCAGQIQHFPDGNCLLPIAGSGVLFPACCAFLARV